MSALRSIGDATAKSNSDGAAFGVLPADQVRPSYQKEKHQFIVQYTHLAATTITHDSSIWASGNRRLPA